MSEAGFVSLQGLPPQGIGCAQVAGASNGITPREHFLPHACGAGTGCARKRRHYSGFSSIVNQAGL
jgi:hypothetical protein